MAARAETIDTVLDLAFGGDGGMAPLLEAERILLARRAAPPDVTGAVRQALAAATGTDDTTTPEARAALAIAAAVERHGAAFPPGREPAYHDRHHQAEACLAMGWLAGAALRLGLIDRTDAARAVAGMAAHDLLHDGRADHPRGTLERRSAEAAATLAAAEGMSAGSIARMRRLILATTWPWEEAEAPDLPCRMAREADLFGSSLPRLGPRLSRLLAIELATAGQATSDSVASHAARVALLRLLDAPTEPARLLRLEASRQAQIAAYAALARRLALASARPEAAAAVLDAMDPRDAQALLASGEAA